MVSTEQKPTIPSGLPEQLVIEDLDAIKAVADPLRLRLMRAMIDGPRTVKQLAAELDVPQTRLYYHMKLLEKHGLISVAGRRIVSGIEERSYVSPVGGWTISKDAMSDAVEAGLLAVIFDVTRAELEVALGHSDSEPGTPGSDVPMLTFNQMWLTDDEVAEIQRTMLELFDRFDTSGPKPGKSEYNGVFAVFRKSSQPSEERDAPAS